MKNKELINKLKNNAELAMATYGYFHLVGKKFNDDKNKTKEKRDITLHDILDSTYKGYKACVPSRLPTLPPETIGKLDGDFTPTQSKNFFDRYELLKHCPNTDSGFSATLFEDTQDSNQKIFAIRGTELSDWRKDIVDADMDLALGKLASNQYIDMIKFYEDCVQKYITERTPLVIVGHSLGGCLAQLLTLSLATSANANNVKEVYTFNSPGAKNLEINDNNLGGVYEIDSTILATKDKERALFKKIRGYEYEGNSNLLRDSTLIGYDSSLFNEIYKYFANTENLKEHSILVRTFAMSSTRYIGKSMISSVIYTYKIFSINETFIKCLNTLKTNNLLKQPLTCQDSIHHIKTDDDDNPDNIRNRVCKV